MNVNLFIIGAAKSGTTSLCEYLAQHPQIFVPNIKEPQSKTNYLIRKLSLNNFSSILFLNERTIKLERGHTISGNPDRFEDGEIVLKESKNHHYKFSFKRIIVYLLTLPLRFIYGYWRIG